MYEVRTENGWDFGRTFRLAIILFRNGKVYIAEPLNFIELPEYLEPVKATLECKSSEEFLDFIKAFQKAGQQIGILENSEAELNRFKGLVEAKNEHLKDLRMLIICPHQKTLGNNNAE